MRPTNRFAGGCERECLVSKAREIIDKRKNSWLPQHQMFSTICLGLLVGLFVFLLGHRCYAGFKRFLKAAALRFSQTLRPGESEQWIVARLEFVPTEEGVYSLPPMVSCQGVPSGAGIDGSLSIAGPAA